MNALLINGSPHKNGATARVLCMISEHIKENYSCDFINAYDLKIRPCFGCMKCRPDKECILPSDDGHAIGKKIKDADLLVVGSPSYWSNMPAPLKLVFDRNVSTFEYCLDKPPLPNMTGKNAIIAATCASDETRSNSPYQLTLLAENLNYILKSSGYNVIKTLKVHSSWNIEQYAPYIKNQIEQIKLI